MHRISARFGGLCAVLVAAAGLAGASPASAAITTTHVTSPTEPFYTQYLNDSADPQQFTVTGTTDSTDPTTDTVDIRCYYSGGGSSYTTLASGVALNPDGSFSATASKDYVYYCILRAIPTSASPSGSALGPFTGPHIGMGYFDTYNYIGETPTQDYEIETGQSLGGANIYGLGDYGIYDMYLFTPGQGAYSGNYYNNLTDGSSALGAVFSTDGGINTTADHPSGSSQVVVDGHNAYPPYIQAQINHGAPGEQSVSVTEAVDPATGVMTATDTEPLAFCMTSADVIDDTYGPSNTTCDHFADAHVQLVRSIRNDRGGRQVTLGDHWQSTDGAAHPVRIAYEDDWYEGCYFQFPGESSFNGCNYGPGHEVSLPAKAPATIYVRYSDSYVNYDNPMGSETYLTQPDRVVFDDFDSDYSYQTIYNRTVPATGSLDLTTIYNQGASESEVRSAASAAEDAGARPAVAISSPANGAVVHNDTIAVTGTATDNVAVTSLKVNGLSTSVNPDGTWSQTVSGLTPGANTITAVATDGSGNSSQASETVVYSPPAAPACIVPKVGGKTLAQAKAMLTVSGCTLGNTSKATSTKVAKGKVARQGTKGGATVPAYFPVNLVISSGKPGRAHLAHRTVSVKHGRVKLEVVCPKGDGNPCNGSLNVRTLSGRHMTLGTGPHAFQAPAGKKRAVIFSLTKGQQSRLAAQGSTRADVYIITRGTSGKAAFTKSHIRIKG